MYNEIPEITSEWFSEHVVIGNERFVVEGRFYVDVTGMYWYRYDDITEFFEMDYRISDKLYMSMALINKLEVYDKNSYDYYGHQCISYSRFISGDAVRKLVERNSNRQKAYIKVLNNLEFENDVYSLYEEDEELSDICSNIQKAAEHKDYESLTRHAYDLCNSKSGRDMLDKMGVISKEKMELANMILDDVFGDNNVDSYKIEEIEINMKRKNDKERTIKYKRVEDIRNDIPWLKELVK